MEERFSLLIKVEHKAHWVIDLCHRPVWCLARNGERQRETDSQSERKTDRETMKVMSWVMACALQTQLANMRLHVWLCLSASAWIYTDSVFCLCNDQKQKRGGEHQREKNIPNSLLFENDTYCSSFLSFFCLVGRGVELFLSDLGNKCGGGTLRGRCSGCACPRLIRNILGPDWTVPVASWETPPPREQLLTKRLERLEIRAFSTRQGRVPSKLTTQSFNT